MKYHVKNYIHKVNEIVEIGYAGTFLQQCLRYRFIPKNTQSLMPWEDESRKAALRGIQHKPPKERRRSV